MIIPKKGMRVAMADDGEDLARVLPPMKGTIIKVTETHFTVRFDKGGGSSKDGLVYSIINSARYFRLLSGKDLQSFANYPT
jgi:hypothetical protein